MESATENRRRPRSAKVMARLPMRRCLEVRCTVLIALALAGSADAAQFITQPFMGVRRFPLTKTSPRPLNINVVEIALPAPGIIFQVPPRPPIYPGPAINGGVGETHRLST